MAASSIRARAPLALAAVAVAIAGCGGGSPSASPTTSASEASTEGSARESKPLPGHPKIAGKPSQPGGGSDSAKGRYGSFTRASAAAAERRAERRARSAHRKLARKAGKAAPFLVSEGDNSIPTYGSEASPAVRGEAERSLSRYLQARAAGEWPVACSLMSADVRKQLTVIAGGSSGTKPDCPRSYARLAAQTPAHERADPMVGGIVSLRVESPHAFALFYGPGKQRYMMPLEVEGGAWKVTQIAPVPWPIGSAPGG